ncbi:MAG: ribosome-associated translation inhibitor RaiA [Deltaproteobacteria bacterium]|nr:MAG: ribosome-associated translation inhibitor RaiA [Deltaproteobacteria bacterium]
MQISVTFRNLEPVDSVKQYAVEKCTRLKKYLSTPVDAQVVLARHKFTYNAEIKITKEGSVILGEGDGEDLNSSIDVAIDKVERQIKRMKDRRRQKRKNEASPISVRHAVVEREQKSGGAMIVTSEEFSAKPMTVDEAILQMENNGSDFFVFLNSSSNQVNVIYRRKDGTVGLIEAGEGTA